MDKTILRTCIVTRKLLSKEEMFRIVRTPEGEVKVDDTGKMNGRGAYISKSVEAIEIAKSKKILDKKLEIEVSDEIYSLLLSKIK